MAPSSRPHYIGETTTLRQIMANPACRHRFTKHARERMELRGVTWPDIEKVLTVGHVVLVERKQEDVWRVEGIDLDSRRLAVAVVVYEDAIVVKVVTTF